MDKYTKTVFCNLPTAAELREALASAEGSDVRRQLASLFDKNTFVETGAFVKRGSSDFLSTTRTSEFEGVVCGYGAIDGKLCYVFAEDVSRMCGAIDDRHAKKIADLYRLAISNAAPIIGIFNSNGTDIFEGTSALAAYGKIMSYATRASGVIPQIAYITGKCIGTSAAIASMFDIIVKDASATCYVTSPDLSGIEGAQDGMVSFTGEAEQCSSFIRSLIAFLPSNSSIGVQTADVCTDNLNRKLGNLDFCGEGLAAVSVIADNGLFYELSRDYAPETVTAFASVGGVRCGIVASSFAVNEGRICAASARKISRFVSLCDGFSIPVITLADSYGLAIDPENEDLFAPELAKLAFAYAGSTCPKITVIMKHAIGAGFVLLGSKSLGADIVYAIDDSEIGALSAESGVAFAWDRYITEDKKREDLIAEWKNTVSSPVNAASSGEIDDIISVNELRARICSALLMLSAKGNVSATPKRRILPL
ncbi:MAG: hypothetical protein J6Q85_01365 [Clostridia bacterium]|nr:hypothetical protein [Clostridia bacterium]